MGSTSTHTRTENNNGQITVTKTVTTVDDDGNESTQVFVSRNGGEFNDEDGEDESNDNNDDNVDNVDGQDDEVTEESNDDNSRSNGISQSSNGNAALQAHNEARAEVGLGPLQWDEGLCQDARDWADRINHDPNWPHCPDDQRKGQGENLWRGSGYSGDILKMAVDNWVNEKKEYEAKKRGESHDTDGHYSMYLWLSQLLLTIV